MAGEQRPVTRAEALAALARQQAAWDDLVARVGPDRLDLPGSMGARTFKDLADHLTVWEQGELARLTAALAGEPEPAPPWPPELTGDDERNAWMQARTATRSGATVLAEAWKWYATASGLGGDAAANTSPTRRCRRLRRGGTTPA